MTVEVTDAEVVTSTNRLREILVAMGRLTPEGAVRIDEEMRNKGIGLGEAAVRLGLISAEDLATVIRTARQSPRNASDGIVEGALNKMAGNYGLPVKYVRVVKAGPSLILAQEPDNTYGEQIRALRTELLLLRSASRSGTLTVILSPCRGEGRTQLCAELAIAFSQLGQRTLLVDADLRRPRVHTLFEADNSSGLSQALDSRGDPELLSVEKLPYLSVVIAGPTVSNPLELLTNGHFQRQLSDWRKKYNMVIIDTPPISEFADALAIASFADQVVVVGRADSTPQKNMKEMLRRMGSTQARIVGAVINNF